MVSHRAPTTATSERPIYLFTVPWSLRHLGGVNQAVRSLATRMKDSGDFDPVVLVSDWDAVAPTWDDVDGVTVLRLRLRPPPFSLREWVWYLPWEIRCRARLRSLFRGRRIAAINPHFVGPLAMTVVRVVGSRTSPVPLILSFHGADVAMLRDAAPVAKERWRRFLREARAIVACSADLARDVTATFVGIHVDVVHNGLDAEAFVASAGIASVGIARPGMARVILNVAKFEHKKGQDILIEAFATLAADYADVTLVLAGATSEALPRIEAMRDRLGLGGRVRLAVDVPRDAVARLYAAATAFALPSRQEPFGIAVLEAGAFGLPVVASRVGGIPEIVTDGVNGRLVAPDEPTALATALRSVLDDPAAGRVLGARLRETVLRTFTLQAAEAAYIRFLATTEPARSSEAALDAARAPAGTAG